MPHKKHILIYIAGKLNDDACGYISNLHNMIYWDDKIRKLGFCTFCPGYDFLGGLLAGDWDYNEYFDNNQVILERCDAMFLVPGWETSEGTKREIVRAEENEIPVFDCAEDLFKYFENEE